MMFFRRRNKLVQEDVQRVIKWAIAEDLFLGKLEKQLAPLLDSIIKQGTSLRGVKGAVRRVGNVEFRLDDNVKDLLFKLNKQNQAMFDQNSKKALAKLTIRIEIERATLLRDLSRYSSKINYLLSDLETQLRKNQFDELVKTATSIKSIINSDREQCRALIADLESVMGEISTSKALQRSELDKIGSFPEKITFLISHIREICNNKDVLRKIKLQNALEMWISTIDGYIAEDKYNFNKLIKEVQDVEHIEHARTSDYYNSQNSITPQHCPYLFQNMKFIIEWKKKTHFKLLVGSMRGDLYYQRIGVAHFSIILAMCGLYEAASMLLLKFIDVSDVLSADSLNAQDLLISTLSVAEVTHQKFVTWNYYSARWHEVYGDRLNLSLDVSHDSKTFDSVVHHYTEAIDLFAKFDDAGYSRVSKKVVMLVLSSSKRDAVKLQILNPDYVPYQLLFARLKTSYFFSGFKVWSMILSTWKKVSNVHPLNIAQLYELTGDFERAALTYDQAYSIDNSVFAARKVQVMKKVQQFRSTFSLDLIEDLPSASQITFILIAILKNKNIFGEEDSGEKKLETERDYVKITKLLLSKVVSSDDADSIFSTYRERNIPFESVWILLGKAFEKKEFFVSAGHCFVQIKDWKRASRCFHYVDPKTAQSLLAG